jgi:hypothetical protein
VQHTNLVLRFRCLLESRALLPMVVLEPATKQALVFAPQAVFVTMVSRVQATTSATR